MSTQLSQEQMQAIDNYGESIQTLGDYITAVRKIPGMYLGPLQGAGYTNQIREIFQNSVDQLLAEEYKATYIYLYINLQNFKVIVEDNGKGLPFDSMVRILTTPHTSKNYTKTKGQYSSGRHGQGMKVVNALSEYLIGESYRYDGKAVRLRTEKGYPTTEEPVPIPNPTKKQGTRIEFVPDLDILGDINVEWRHIFNLVKHIISLTPIGNSVDFECVDYDGKVYKEKIINKDGILTDLIMKVKHPIIKPIVLSDDDGERKLDIAFCYDSGGETGPDDRESITSFSNFCPTLGGTHVDGSIEGITRWFTMYMNNIYLNNQKAKDKIKVTAVDIKNGLNVMISAAHLEPNLIGQSKELLSNPDMVGFCKEVVMKGLDQWSKSNPQDLAKISKFFKDMAELRTKAESSKAKIVTKYQANPLSGLPAKYIKPLGKEHLELLIVEGDSACGSATIARNKQTQGLFPIRGKIINAFRASKQAVFSNEEIQGIVRIILGSEYKRNFPVEDCKVEKVIFMADGDVDKSHCRKMLFAKPCGSSL